MSTVFHIAHARRWIDWNIHVFPGKYDITHMSVVPLMNLGVI